jgi:hypothetical protein
MEKLERSKLWSLEEYAEERDAFRAAVMAHKKPRRVALGPHVSLYFEDFTTMKYQVQEMLRAEKIFTPAEIAEEIEAYNPLIPDGTNWKATLMIEYPDVEERRLALARLRGIEESIWARVGNAERVFAIANEDLERTTDDKTAAVHFLRFELSEADISDLQTGASLSLGCDHPEMREAADPVPDATREALVADLA